MFIYKAVFGELIMSNLTINEKVRQIEESRERIEYFRQAKNMHSHSMVRWHYENAVVQEIKYVSDLLKEICYDLNKLSNEERFRQQREFTIEELSNYDGSGGKPAYVAVNGIVYDVSNEPTWGGASHFGLIAGKDLTAQFNGCHGVIQILSKLPKVGVLKSPGTTVP
jgi:predicted heme/steroid binding protein